MRRPAAVAAHNGGTAQHCVFRTASAAGLHRLCVAGAAASHIEPLQGSCCRGAAAQSRACVGRVSGACADPGQRRYFSGILVIRPSGSQTPSGRVVPMSPTLMADIWTAVQHAHGGSALEAEGRNSERKGHDWNCTQRGGAKNPRRRQHKQQASEGICRERADFIKSCGVRGRGRKSQSDQCTAQITGRGNRPPSDALVPRGGLLEAAEAAASRRAWGETHKERARSGGAVSGGRSPSNWLTKILEGETPLPV